MVKEDKLLTIREAAETLGISVDTLRRWDKSGKLPAVRKEGGVHRYYRQEDLDAFASDVIQLAQDWTTANAEFPAPFYCENSGVFQARIVRMENQLLDSGLSSMLVPLIVAVAGEIGNNSFDHNLGQWPDTPGIFFGFDDRRGQIVLADRGLGVLATLRRIRPGLKDHTDALRVAFTEVISGRAPEARGNGLKFVRQVIAENPIGLVFRSGDAELRLKKTNSELFLSHASAHIRGCFAVITY